MKDAQQGFLGQRSNQIKEQLTATANQQAQFIDAQAEQQIHMLTSQVCATMD